MATKRKAVVVTTSKRGVFFGYSPKRESDETVLTDARMCVYWSTDVNGVLGLASGGPTKTCRITPSVSELRLPTSDIDSTSVATDVAVAAWEVQPWG